jgi:hypothetical protein
MQIPIEPNLDTPIPAEAYPQRGDTYEQRLKIAGNTALLLNELGVDDDISEEEEVQAQEMFAKIKPADDKTSKPTKDEKKSLEQYGIARTLGGYISEYEKQVVADKVQVRTIVVNRLMEISQTDDDKVALKALELLGKASDLFTERSEITITHKTSDELKAAIKERIKLLMGQPMKDIPSSTEKRLSQLSHNQAEVVDVTVLEKIKDDD